MEDRISFNNLNLSEDILKAIDNLGFETPSEVQAKVIPYVLEEKNVIVRSQTGTGKTAAFGIPLCEKIELEEREVQAVILTPTRELAVQVAKDINDIGRFKRLRAVPIFGGQPIDIQLKTLKQRIHIIVSTPGRLLDHLERGSIQLSNVKFLVIDEADEMFNMGFIDDVEKIIKSMQQEKQIMLFSATMSEKVKRITEKYMSDALNIENTHEKLMVEKIAQCYYSVEEKSKLLSLNKILSVLHSKGIIIFCNTKKNVDMVVEYLNSKKFSSYGLHGDMSQEDRLDIMNKFRKREFQYLVATDVAARGIDIESITHVVNFDIPLYAENYVHRIGRTGRAGSEGEAITLVTDREERFLRGIEEYTDFLIPKRELPSSIEIKESVKKKLDMDLIENKNVVEIKPQKNIKASKEITKLHISLGRKNKIRPTDIVGAIIGATGLSGDIIGIIDIYDNFSYVDIMEGQGKKVLEIMKDATIKGKKVKIEKAIEKK